MLEGTTKVYLDTIPFLPQGRVVALGFYDGIHLGHLEIIKKAVKIAKGKGLVSTVQTFTNFPKNEGRLMTNINDRLQILSDIGVDELLVLDYEAVKDMAPEAFLSDIIRNRVGATVILSGDDYSFGAKAAGKVDLLQDFCQRNEIEVKIHNEKIFPETGRRVSSSWLRECLNEGDVELYSRLCAGRFYDYQGIVVKGKQLGRKLGFPTVNVLVPEDKVVVRRGVYVSRVTLGHQTFYGVTNIGRRPTVEDAMEDVVETYIFDFDDDIYGARIKVELLQFLRPETKFTSEEELVNAVNSNKAEAKSYIAQNFE